MSSKTYRIGIVGIGGIAKMHALAIGDLANAELVAGVCRTESKGKQFVEQHGGRWYSDYQQMMDEEKPDLITIATPSGTHLEPTLAAAERGIHVLCEKPLEIRTDRVDRMIEAAREAGIVLGGIFPQRFNPVMQAVHGAAEEGRFGPLATSVAYVPWWRDDAYYAPERWQGTVELDGGGAMINQSIHAIDAAQWLAGTAMRATGTDPADNPVDQVFAFTGKRGHDPELIEVEDTGVAALRYRDGAMGLILAATSMWPGTSQRVHVAGRDGTAEVHEQQMVTYQFREERDADERVRKQYGQAGEKGGASDPMAIDYSNHTRNIESFLSALDAGEDPPINGPEARKAVSIIEAVYRSAEAGRPVRPK